MAGDSVPTIVLHGDRDTTVHPSNADRILRPRGPDDQGDDAFLLEYSLARVTRRWGAA